MVKVAAAGMAGATADKVEEEGLGKIWQELERPVRRTCAKNSCLRH